MASKKTELLLVGTFSLFPRKKSTYKVSLTRLGITYEYLSDKQNDSSREKYIHFGDIIGCRCRRSKMTEDPTAYFTIYAYPFRKKSTGSKQIRYRMDITFGTCDSSDFQENFLICQKWRNVIAHISRGIQLSAREVESCLAPDMRKLLILINPHSGQGRAQQMYEKEVEPMLMEADIYCQVIKTEYAGHASDLMKTLDLSQWYAVVIVSGDGLIYEVLNGLMHRPDLEEARRFPFGCVPGGSGNAMCWSINYRAGEPLGEEMVLHSTFVLIKHRVMPIDIVSVITPTQKIYSFLSISWGIVADVDYESEKLRSIGAARFTIYLFLKVMKMKSYRGKLSFLPAGKYVPKSKQMKENIGSKSGVSFMKRSSSRDTAGSVSEVGCQGKYVPHRQISENSERLRSVSVPVMPNSMNQNGSTNGLNSLFEEELKEENLSVIGRNGESSVRFTLPSERRNCDSSMSGASEIGNNIDAGGAGGPVNHFEHSNSTSQEHKNYAAANGDSSGSLLPPLDQPVPEDWITLHEDFITILAAYQPYLGGDMLISPDARLDDGVIYLMFLKAGIPRSALVNIFLQFEQGGHINSPYVEIVKVHAFRLEPDQPEGNLMVDGEKIDVTPLQAEMHPSFGRVLAIQ